MNAMTTDSNLSYISETIKGVIASRNLTTRRLILFGSRANSTATRDSDWDFLVGIDEEIPFSEKVQIMTAIQRKLAIRHLSADIIVKSDRLIERESGDIGHIVHYALRSGMRIE